MTSIRNITLVASWVALTGAVALARSDVTAAITPRQAWDYAAELDLTREQQAALSAIKEKYEAVRADVRRASVTNTPPDVRRAAQLRLNDQIRVANRRIGEVLTPEQKATLDGLRKQRERPGQVSSPKEPDGDIDGAEDDAPPLAPTRKPPRPKMTEGEYRSLAAELRLAYSQVPARWPAPHIDEEVKPHFRELGLLPPVEYPADNSYSDTKAELGKKLFFDPRLSGSRQISCANCHDPDLAFADGRTASFGHERTPLKRNAPTVLNSGFSRSLFWDGRANSLEQQAMEVVNNADEMHSSVEIVRDNLAKISGYSNDFAVVFGSSEVTLERVAKAIATFERTITSRDNPFDSFLRGNTNALSDAAVRGLHLFRTAARCINCHNGPNFTDGRFHNEGLTYYGRKYQDLGRYEATKDPADVGKFKTPTLRNIARTGPYMHNGLFDLEGVLNMYNAGMPSIRPRPGQQGDPRFPVKSPHLQPLGLNLQDLSDVRAFLEALTETRFRLRPPEKY